MTRKPRTRSHLRAVQALVRFRHAKGYDAQMFRASIVAKYLDEQLVENATVRAENVALREAAAREKAERKAFLTSLLVYARKGA